jgi:hypothetical protein
LSHAQLLGDNLGLARQFPAGEALAEILVKIDRGPVKVGAGIWLQSMPGSRGSSSTRAPSRHASRPRKRISQIRQAFDASWLDEWCRR